jgi:hypothetical protein
MIIRAIDHETAHIGGAHFSEGDFLGPVDFGHSAIIAPAAAGVKPLDIGPSPRGHTMARASLLRTANSCSALHKLAFDFSLPGPTKVIAAFE